MGLGFRARGQMVAAEDGDGGGDGDSLHFYVAITVPQMPLSKIDGMVNLISTWKAKERHLFFSACWRHYSARCEIFAGNQIFARANLLVCSGPTNTAKWNPEKWTKETQKLMAPLEWMRNENFEGSKSYRKKSYEALWIGSSGGNPGSTARKSASKRRCAVARADAAPWRMPCTTTS